MKRSRIGKGSSKGVRKSKKTAVSFRGSAVPIPRVVAQPTNRQLVRNPRDMGYVDYTTYQVSAWEANSTGSVVYPFTVAMGTGSSERVGRNILLRGIVFRGQITANSTASNDKPVLLMVYDNSPTGSLPSVSDILSSPHPLAQNNPQNSSRFRIIRRFAWNIDGGLAAGQMTSDSTHSIEEYIDLKGKKVEYKQASGGSGAIGDVQKGAIYFLLVGFRAAASPTCSTLFFSARLQFVDI